MANKTAKKPTKKTKSTKSKTIKSNSKTSIDEFEKGLKLLRRILIFILNTICLLSVLKLSSQTFPMGIRKIELYLFGSGVVLLHFYIYFWLFKEKFRKTTTVLYMLLFYFIINLIIETILQTQFVFSNDFRAMLGNLNFEIIDSSFFVGGIWALLIVWGLKNLLGSIIYYILLGILIVSLLWLTSGYKYFIAFVKNIYLKLKDSKENIKNNKTKEKIPKKNLKETPRKNKKSILKSTNKNSKPTIKKDPYIYNEESVVLSFDLSENKINKENINIPKNKIDEIDFNKPKINKPKVNNSTILDTDKKINAKEEILSDNLNALENKYIFPPKSLLNPVKQNKSSEKNKILESKKLLNEILVNFKINAKIVDVHMGPTVTMYEIQLAPGVKINKLTGLSNDIALGMAANGIRIAPVPNKPTVGIEVPNKEKESVPFRKLIDSYDFSNDDNPLNCALGMDISGHTILLPLNKMPHLLIAGATGSGKSVCINTIIVSLLYKASPDDVKMIMIDPKVVELSVYNKIPHLIYPVVTDPQKASGVLQWVVLEMNNRYKLFAETGVRDISHYNEMCKESETHEKIPFMVVIIDELADLMLSAPKEIEDSICRIAQMARAAGIHLIIATQRPSVDVITGLIKANIPSRIAFSVSSQTDSRTILDVGGAEKLLGKGDMLYYPVGAPKPDRLQGAFISEKEVQKIVAFVEKKEEVKSSESLSTYLDTVKPEVINDNEASTKWDPIIVDVIDHVLKDKKISVSMVQRKFRVGYARAARIVDSLEDLQIISGYNGSKPRDLIMKTEDVEDIKANIKGDNK